MDPLKCRIDFTFDWVKITDFSPIGIDFVWHE